MHRFGSCCDDFYLNMTLNTELELNGSRESVIHYFEQVRKKFPVMRNFFARERGEFVLEEDKEQGHYRWVSCESKRICSGFVNPSSLDLATAQHQFILELAPFALSASTIDCESLNVVYRFALLTEGITIKSSRKRWDFPPHWKVCWNFLEVQRLPMSPRCRFHSMPIVEPRSASASRRGAMPITSGPATSPKNKSVFMSPDVAMEASTDQKRTSMPTTNSIAFANPSSTNTSSIKSWFPCSNLSLLNRVAIAIK